MHQHATAILTIVARQVPQVLVVIKDMMVSLANQDNQVCQVYQATIRQFHCHQMDVVVGAHLDHLVNQVNRDNKDRRDRAVAQEIQATQAGMEMQEQQAHQATEAIQVPQADQDQLATLAVQLNVESRENQDVPATEDNRANRVKTYRAEAIRAEMAAQDHLAHQETLDAQAVLASEAAQAVQVREAHQAKTLNIVRVQDDQARPRARPRPKRKRLRLRPRLRLRHKRNEMIQDCNFFYIPAFLSVFRIFLFFSVESIFMLLFSSYTPYSLTYVKLF